MERLQMDFHWKGYGSKREYNIVTNGHVDKLGGSDISMKNYMKVACAIIFSQMSAKLGLKKV